MEDDYNITASLVEPKSNDTTSILDYTKIKNTTIIDDAFDREIQNMSSIERLQRVEKMTLIDQAKYSSIFSELASLKPIHKRVSNVEIELLLQSEFRDRDLDLDFDYRVFSQNLATKVGSDRYSNLEGLKKYSMPLFENDEGISDYSLVVGFPNRTQYLRSSISFLIVLSVFFILVIIMSFYFTVLNSIKQKNISEMKTDFINNMTHEFKTPIATINLALSAIKNPKTIVNKEKVKKYLQMIYDENNRMHDQVENVLMISHLERNQLNIEKTKQDINEIIDLAISHVSLIVENNNGNIITEKDADNSMVIGNETHLINVLVNILDNAIKYNDNSPKIFIKTLNIGSRILIEIKDNGIGMTKKIKTKIFEKFYRESKGNIHNIKGHGLGLAFVKKIVELHAGFISVQSQIGKGSTFKITLNNVNKT